MEQNAPPTVTAVSPQVCEDWMRNGDTVLIDVREEYEHAEERIRDAVLHPLSRFDAVALNETYGDKRVVFHCRSGKRSQDAAERFLKHHTPVFHLAGGIEGWKASGRQVILPATGGQLPMMRQVQIIAGALVTFGVAMGLTVSPWFYGVAAFVGCGLLFAGISGWCGMAKLLALMPWNRVNHTNQ
jgi:rhodanese-related sulfurtransferase